MTDKQIIIDDQKKTIHRLQDECTEKTNAIIALGEQLKRKEQRIVELNKTIKTKEQECEELKAERDSWKYQWDKRYEICECLSDQLDQLKAENDTLRQFLSKEPLALQALQSAYSSYKKSADVFYEMVKQYKRTLTEIKEIAENLAPMTDEYDDCYDRDRCFECEFTDICKYFNVKLILQKISEVVE